MKVVVAWVARRRRTMIILMGMKGVAMRLSLDREAIDSVGAVVKVRR
jgi:hypothetical protein